MKIKFIQDERVSDGSAEAVVEVLTLINNNLNDWLQKNNRSESFKDLVILSALVNALSLQAVEMGVPVWGVLINIIKTFHANGGLDEDDPTVH